MARQHGSLVYAIFRTTRNRAFPLIIVLIGKPASAPITTIVPLGPSPPTTACIASALVTVARITLARGILNGQMSKAADAKHGNELARSGIAVSKRVEGSDTCTQQRSRFNDVQLFGHVRHGGYISEHVRGIAAITGDARYGLDV